MSVFKRLLEAPTKTPKRRCVHRKKTFFDEEYLEVTVNMTGRGRAQSVASHYDSKHEPERDGVYRHTQS